MLTDRQTKSQTDTAENNTTLTARVAKNGKLGEDAFSCKFANRS